MRGDILSNEPMFMLCGPCAVTCLGCDSFPRQEKGRNRHLNDYTRLRTLHEMRRCVIKFLQQDHFRSRQTDTLWLNTMRSAVIRT